MKNYYCHGFYYDTEEELKQLLDVEEYLDLEFNKGNGGWVDESHWDEKKEEIDLSSSLAMDVYVKRKAEGLTQRELATKLGISLDTIVKIENGHENLRTKVKAKIEEYINEEW